MSLFFETLREQLQMLVCALRFDPQAERFDEGVIPQREAHGDLADNFLVDAVEKTSVLLVALAVPNCEQLRCGPHTRFGLRQALGCDPSSDASLSLLLCCSSFAT